MSQLRADHGVAYALREIVLPRRLFRSIRLFEIAGVPQGAEVAAFSVRTPFPVAFMTGNSWPAVLLGKGNQLDEQAAQDLLRRGQAASVPSSHLLPRSERTSPWVATHDRAPSVVSPVPEGPERSLLMAAQWVAEWFSHLVSAPVTQRVYALVAEGRPQDAIQALATAAVDEEIAVPRRYLEAMRRLVDRAGMNKDLLWPVEGLVPSDDRAWSWAELVDVPRVRVRWLGAPQTVKQRLCEIEFTPRGTSVPEWTRTVDKSSALIESLLGREFGSEVNIQMADDRFNEEPRWISLFPQDNI
ncbi:hypothetical protein [Paeniglutamicibacter sulfureus]|uniref:Uncharacterized protein n=1 Tax=Paeniglutamicibacter sulfureus TaxID=43666 RepID=A0ABU2BEV9_9MICC|nr:hypothetical protein [Paeniglutamicibacter sulfureus]MDR7357174.1 hypothetical protein [Paeniglutamicibacter sulfureus]